jgi:hypothetical protein
MYEREEAERKRTLDVLQVYVPNFEVVLLGDFLWIWLLVKVWCRLTIVITGPNIVLEIWGLVITFIFKALLNNKKFSYKGLSNNCLDQLEFHR